MTIIENSSRRRKRGILGAVKRGEYSCSYALDHVEDLNDAGKLTGADYQELAEYLENLLNEEEKEENNMTVTGGLSELDEDSSIETVIPENAESEG